MKRSSYKFLKVMIAFTVISLTNCGNYNNKQNREFIYLQDGRFRYKGKDFFPMMINYSVCFREINDSLIISPIKDYDLLDSLEGNTKDSIQNILTGHLKYMRELGFNSIRLITSGFKFDKITGDITIQVYPDNEKPYNMQLGGNINRLLNSYKEFFAICREQDIRVMLKMIRHTDIPKAYELRIKYIKKFLHTFRNEPTIFAYDFFNEPLYFDKDEFPVGEKTRSKQEVYEITTHWRALMDKYAPNHLLTIGLSEPIEVFEWDPNIIPVDFIAFHTYHPLRVPNEIYWYANYTNKPWMIGETSLPADNDSISYEDQKQFLTEIYQRVIDCGGIGFGWWAFQDVTWGAFGHDHTSIINHQGTTWTADKKHLIYGSPKPAALEFNNLSSKKSSGVCKPWVNYYNMIGYQNIVIEGKIINKKTGTPIEGAVIRGWNKSWKIAANTFSNAEGVFKLYSNTEFVHFYISAPGMNLIKFSDNLRYDNLTGKYPSLDDLPDQELEYHNISYTPFLNNDSSNIATSDKIFNFKKDAFNKAHFKGTMKVKYLHPLVFDK